MPSGGVLVLAAVLGLGIYYVPKGVAAVGHGIKHVAVKIVHPHKK